MGVGCCILKQKVMGWVCMDAGEKKLEGWRREGAHQGLNQDPHRGGEGVATGRRPGRGWGSGPPAWGSREGLGKPFASEDGIQTALNSPQQWLGGQGLQICEASCR